MAYILKDLPLPNMGFSRLCEKSVLIRKWRKTLKSYMWPHITGSCSFTMLDQIIIFPMEWLGRKTLMFLLAFTLTRPFRTDEEAYSAQLLDKIRIPFLSPTEGKESIWPFSRAISHVKYYNPNT